MPSSLFPPDGHEARERVREELTRGAARLVIEIRPLREADEVYEPSLSEQVRSLGFSGQAAKAFDLLPLVLVAWADGTIQTEERAKILEVLTMRGLAGTQAFTTVQALLEVRPADVYLQAALQVLRALVAERPDGGASVVDLCIEVAAAAHDAIGSPDPISAEEREAIAAVAQTLGPRAHEELVRRLGPDPGAGEF